jgi:hypothetical protein
MSELSLDEEMNFEVTARFIAKGNDEPVTGDMYKVRLFDRDIFTDDHCIGESSIDANGMVKIAFPAKVYEDAPDLGFGPEFYFTVLKEGKTITSTKVIREIDVEAIERYKKGEGEVLYFGTFLIDA